MCVLVIMSILCLLRISKFVPVILIFSVPCSVVWRPVSMNSLVKINILFNYARDICQPG